MKRILLAIFLAFGLGNLYAQIDNEILRKAIGYYQQLEFEKSIEIFDQLVLANPDDYSLQGRRGFVISEYLKAMNDNTVVKVEANIYDDLLNKGLSDLKQSLEKFPYNADNKNALSYLKGL
ncbi:MAG: hypothetical protein ACPGLV_09555 [Bacteroidia bacterium]